MIFRQIVHDDLGCASYLIGDEDAGIAAVVDPRFEIEEYVARARYLGVDIEHILETHNHADHLSGHGRLAEATGATIHINRLAEPDYDYHGFDDGWELELGRVQVRALHTPGHRPEHTSFVLTDRSRGDSPWAVLTGDSLFVGDIARPDLAVDEREGAGDIFHSLHDRLLVLPAECEIWPGHLGGSLCGGAGMDLKICSTIGFERKCNELLSEEDREAFIEKTIAGLGPQPPRFETIVALNRGPLVTEAVEIPLLSAHQVDRKRSEGALLVDVRTESHFDQAHIPGAVSIPAIRAGFGTKLAWVTDQDKELVLLGRDEDDARRAARLAAAAGIRDVAGCLAGGMTGWQSEERPVEAVETIDVDQLRRRFKQLQVVDVREDDEWESARIPGTRHLPYHDVDAIPEDIDPRLPIAVICSSGQRSAVAASLLLRHGADRVIRVAGGGVGTWAERGWPIEPAG